MSSIVLCTQSDKSSISTIVAALVDTKWLERTQSAQDRRQRTVTLTPKAKQHLKGLEKIYENIADALISRLNSKEQKAFSKMLSKARAGLSNATPDFTKTNFKEDK